MLLVYLEFCLARAHRERFSNWWKPVEFYEPQAEDCQTVRLFQGFLQAVVLVDVHQVKLSVKPWTD